MSIDASAALAVPGVHLVMTAADLPQPMPRFGPQVEDRPVLAIGETKYHGDPVAAVAADTKDAAEAGARLVQVSYEELPAVVTLAAALAPGAPLVQDPSLRPNDPLARTNVFKEHRVGWGDVEATPADLVVDHTYTFPMVTHFAIEPHAFMAAPDGDGIAVWSSIQHPNWLQRIVADGAATCRSRRCASWLPTREVASVASSTPSTSRWWPSWPCAPVDRYASCCRSRSPSRPCGGQPPRCASGRACADGTIAFQDIAADYLIGAYVDIADRVVSKGSYVGAGPYRMPAARIVARGVLSHTVPSTAFRGFGNPQVNWAVESNLDEAARRLGIDRLDIRLRNLARKGEAFIPWDTPADGDWQQTVRRAAELIGWDTPTPAGRGRGIAVGLKSGPTTGLSYSTVRLLADGSVVVYAGTSDMGQGARTVFAQIAGHELGAPLDWVTVVMGDTAVVPYDQQTSASRSTVLMGNAVLAACRDIQARLRTMASRLHDVPEGDIVVADGVVRLPGREVPIREVLAAGLGRLGR